MIQLEDNTVYIRADGKLTKVKKTGYLGFLAFQGSDGTYYTKEGIPTKRGIASKRAIVSKYETKEVTPTYSDKDFIKATALGVFVVFVIFMFLP